MAHLTNWQHARRAALCIIISIPTSIWSETDGITSDYQLGCFAASIIAIICGLFHVHCISEKNNPLVARAWDHGAPPQDETKKEVSP